MSCGKCSANKLICEIERRQRHRVQRMMWRLCDENRKLGGSEWRKVISKFGLKESDLWVTEPKAKATYSGHVPCSKCGTTHWMHGDCPQPKDQTK